MSVQPFWFNSDEGEMGAFVDFAIQSVQEFIDSQARGVPTDMRIVEDEDELGYWLEVSWA